MARMHLPDDGPFLVTRSETVCLINGESHWEYAIYTAPDRYKEVDRATALKFIDDHMLTEAFDAGFGQVYDTPDKDFLQRYRGFFHSEYEEEKRKLKEHAKQAAMTRAEAKLQKKHEAKSTQHGVRTKADV